MRRSVRPGVRATSLATGLLIVVPYLAAAKGLPAHRVRYANGTSGLAATNVQDALDAIAARLQAVVRPATRAASHAAAEADPVATTWTGTVYDVAGATGDTLRTNEITVAFTPETDTTGTVESQPVNLLAAVAATYPQPCGDEQGRYVAHYRIVENLMFVTSVVSPQSTPACPASGFLNMIAVAPTKLVFTAGTMLPAPLLVLQKIEDSPPATDVAPR